jgi:hypothetical protein
MGHARTWHAMGFGGGGGGVFMGGGGLICQRGSYANGVTGYEQAGVADVMDRVAVFLYRTIHFKIHLAWLMFFHTEAQHLVQKVRDNYTNCTCKRSENICRSSGGSQEKERLVKTG